MSDVNPDHHRPTGDDVIIKLRVRRVNLPALREGVTLGIDLLTGGAIELALHERDDGVFELEVVTNALAMAAAPEAVEPEIVP